MFDELEDVLAHVALDAELLELHLRLGGGISQSLIRRDVVVERQDSLRGARAVLVLEDGLHDAGKASLVHGHLGDDIVKNALGGGNEVLGIQEDGVGRGGKDRRGLGRVSVAVGNHVARHQRPAKYLESCGLEPEVVRKSVETGKSSRGSHGCGDEEDEEGDEEEKEGSPRSCCTMLGHFRFAKGRDGEWMVTNERTFEGGGRA